MRENWRCKFQVAQTLVRLRLSNNGYGRRPQNGARARDHSITSPLLPLPRLPWPSRSLQYGHCGSN
eukprot:11158591-Lingulodinium_polyedra.AAC.1